MSNREPQSQGNETGQNALRVKVAELRGAKWYAAPLPHVEGASAWPMRVLALKQPNFACAVMPIAERNGDALWHDIPNYPSDLNACADMESTLDQNPNLAAKYANTLAESLSNGKWYLIVRATAEQRCRAFVATMEASVPKDADSVEGGLRSDNATGASSKNLSAPASSQGGSRTREESLNKRSQP